MKTLAPNPFVFHAKKEDRRRILIQSALNNEVININLIKLCGVILLMFQCFFFFYQATFSPFPCQEAPKSQVCN